MMSNEGNSSSYSTESRQPAVLHRADWAVHEQLWKGYFQGEDIGTGVTVLFYVTDDVGVGPRWHVHP